tara:strand:- start:218 stop:505 length:288 start_codon:yes stop_codon:yes gene_type:complete
MGTTRISDGGRLTNRVSTHTLFRTLGVSGALDIIFHTNTTSAGFASAAILVHLTRPISARALASNTQSAEGTLAMIFAFRCAGRLDKEETQTKTG